MEYRKRQAPKAKLDFAADTTISRTNDKEMLNMLHLPCNEATLPIIKEAMISTFNDRRVWITTNGPSITQCLTKYPKLIAFDFCLVCNSKLTLISVLNFYL